MKKYSLYRKGSAPPVHARQCHAREKFISKNRLFVSHAGQWLVKPKDAPETAWVDPGAMGTPSPTEGVPVINGAFLEDDNFFTRDYAEYSE
jgi:hypothetical protein